MYLLHIMSRGIPIYEIVEWLYDMQYGRMYERRCVRELTDKRQQKVRTKGKKSYKAIEKIDRIER